MTDHNLFKIHRLEQRTLTWWRTRKDKIDFEPSYQRKGRRWSTSDKQYLVDSILNGFDVPKFYVADFTYSLSRLNEKKKSYAVIDGKQRLEAIFDFFEDKFPLSSSFNLLSDRKVDLRGKKYSELKKDFPEVAEEFDNFNPDIVGVISDDKKYIEELFVRLNRSKPLSGAELRNAVSSPVSEMIRRIGNHTFFSTAVRFDTNKGQNLNSAAKLLMFEVSGIQETKKVNLDRFVSHNTNNQKAVEAAVPIVFETLELMAETFQFRDQLLQSEGPLPIYYWLTRHAKEDEVPFVRDFLDEFQELMKAGTNKGRKQLISLDSIASYKAASRSVNDKTSHEIRYEILNSTFHRWLKLRT
ncbi:DUF262 domain-containing protein [Xanthomonas arboricola]|uniref:DUF262 domain-containing protein n=1 Tax=Xanthomonas arboricola TaxID=56448 RepID=UPI000C82D226|nr:DUF262 domain-containing protein [Xanthomonas arboricola]PPU26732.1 hypothetical protein XarCFBP6762_10205 [Xanthomonas arboricola]SOU04726.1 hypothetical protein CFBP6762_04033 [Xanthomonas arboricola pv. fragariae]